MSYQPVNDLNATCQHVADNLQTFHNAVLDLVKEAQDNPRVNSQMSEELASCSDSEHLKEAYFSAQRAAFQKAVDHLDALSRALTPPILTYSPWVSARCVLEQCSLAFWLADTNIDFNERICRILNTRLRSINDSLTWLRGVDNFSTEPSAEKIDGLRARIKHLRHAARQFDISEKCNRKGRLTGFGDGLPSWTNLAEVAFAAGNSYRMLSGTSHGEFWTSSLSTTLIEGSEDASRLMGPSFQRDHALWIGIQVAEWFAKSSWRIFTVSGWDMKALAATLETSYTKIGFNTDSRFWRKDYLTTIRP